MEKAHGVFTTADPSGDQLVFGWSQTKPVGAALHHGALRGILFKYLIHLNIYPDRDPRLENRGAKDTKYYPNR